MGIDNGYYTTVNWVDHVFNSMYGGTDSAAWHLVLKKETDDSTTYSMDVPGFSKKDISVEYDPEQEVVSICGKSDKGKFNKSYKFKDINENGMHAEVTDGVLTILLTKSPPSKRKVIKIL